MVKLAFTNIYDEFYYFYYLLLFVCNKLKYINIIVFISKGKNKDNC